MHHVDRDTPWDEIWEAFDVLRTQGKVLYFGSSNHAGWHIAKGQEAAKRRGAEPWLRGEIADVIGEPLLERLVSGSVTHAARRLDEMEAAAAYLEELGVEPRISRAAAEWLEALADGRTRPG